MYNSVQIVFSNFSWQSTYPYVTDIYKIYIYIEYTVPKIVNVNREISKLKVDFKGNLE